MAASARASGRKRYVWLQERPMTRGASCCGHTARHKLRLSVSPRQRAMRIAEAARGSTVRSNAQEYHLRIFDQKSFIMRAKEPARA